MIRGLGLRTLWKGLTLHAGRAVWAGLKKAHKIPLAECLELPCGSVPVSPLLQLFWLQKRARPSLLSPLTQSKQTQWPGEPPSDPLWVSSLPRVKTSWSNITGLYSTQTVSNYKQSAIIVIKTTLRLYGQFKALCGSHVFIYLLTQASVFLTRRGRETWQADLWDRLHI